MAVWLRTLVVLLGIIVDGRLISAPDILEEISQGRFRVTGDFEDAEVEELIISLRAGKYPLHIDPNRSRSSTWHRRSSRLSLPSLWEGREERAGRGRVIL